MSIFAAPGLRVQLVPRRMLTPRAVGSTMALKRLDSGGSVRVEVSGFIYDARGRPADKRVAAFVSLCALRSGSLICGFQLGAKKHAVNGTVRLCRSRDGGITWNELPVRFAGTLDGAPGSLSSGEIVEVEPGRL